MIRKQKRNILANMGLIQKIAWMFHLKTGLDFNDLVSEASLAYLEVLQKWDPSRGKLTTFMWYALNNRLQDYFRTQVKHLNHVDSNEIDIPHEDTDTFERMNSEALEIARIIIRTPQKYLHSSPEQINTRIHHILENRNWDAKKVDAGISCLQSIFN